MRGAACVWFDTVGNGYISDSGNHFIREVSTTGIISSVIGTGVAADTGNGGPATSARIYAPYQLHGDTSDVYLTLNGVHTVKVVNLASGILNLVTGTGTAASDGDGGLASSASVNSPRGVFVDASSNVYITEIGAYRVRKVSAADGLISTIIGVGIAGTTGDGGPGTSARINSPNQLFVDTVGRLFVADRLGCKVRMLQAGIVTRFAGNEVQLSTDVTGPATSTSISQVEGVWITTDGVMFLSEFAGNKMKKVSASGQMSTIAGTGVASSVATATNGDGGPAILATFSSLYYLGMDSSGAFYVADSGSNKIRIYPPSAQPSLTLAPSVVPSASPSVQLSDMYSVVNYAGTGSFGYSGNGVQATSAAMKNPRCAWFDTSGDGYISDASNQLIRKVAIDGIITTVVGTSNSGDSGSGGPATSADISAPYQLMGDMNTLYFAANGNHRVKTVDFASGIVTVFTGTGSPGSTGDGGLASSAKLNGPRGIWLDAYQNVYISETSGYRVRKVTAQSGLISTIIGVGQLGSSGDGGAATAVQVGSPDQLYLDSTARLFVADRVNNKVRVLSGGIVTRFAGTETQGSTDITGAATSTNINQPTGVWGTTDGTMFLSEYVGNKAKKVDFGGLISTIAGTGAGSAVASAANGDGGPAILATFNSPYYFGIDSIGSLYLADAGSNKVRKLYSTAPSATPTVSPTIAPSISPTRSPTATPSVLVAPSCTPTSPPSLSAAPSLSMTPSVTPSAAPSVQLSDLYGIVTYAGTGASGYSGNGVRVTSAVLKSPRAIWFDASGNAYISDTNNHFVRKVRTSGIITSVIGTGTAADNGNGGPATSADIYTPYQLVGDNATLYLSVNDNNRVKALNLVSGILSVFAGTGTVGSDGDSGPATSATLNSPRGVWLDVSKNVYIGETSGYRVRKVSGTDGLISTIIGTGASGSGGDGGAATAARVGSLDQLYMDSAARLFVADRGNCRVRTLQAGILSKFAGTGTLGSTDVTAAASSTTLNFVSGVWGTSDGVIFIAEYGGHKIKKITTIAGTGVSGTTANGIRASSAQIAASNAVWTDSQGRVYFSEGLTSVRKFPLSTLLNTIAGNGVSAFAGDGAKATSSSLNTPYQVIIDSKSNVYIADSVNNRIRVVDPSGIIYTLVGTGDSTSGETSGTATATSIYRPRGVWIGSDTTYLYVCESGGHRILCVDQTTQIITTLAGIAGTSGGTGDGGLASSALLSSPQQLYGDTNNKLYVADYSNYRIRVINLLSTVVTTVVGSGYSGSSNSPAPATSIDITQLIGVWGDLNGNIFVSELNKHRVRKASVSDGILRTVVGT
eukprot:gene27612-34360_t